jgi:hypothetical protein
MIEQLLEEAKQMLEAERREMKEQIGRELRKAGEKTIAKVRPVLEREERRR